MVTGERDCAEKRFFSSWTEADYVTVEECEYKRKEAYIEEEDTLIQSGNPLAVKMENTEKREADEEDGCIRKDS